MRLHHLGEVALCFLPRSALERGVTESQPELREEVIGFEKALDAMALLAVRIDDENLDVDETCVLVLKNCGPKGYPGMAEVGNMPLPP